MSAIAPTRHMIGIVLLDSVVMPAKDFYEAVTIIVLLPFVFAFALILFFRLLDKFSTKDVEDTSNL